MARDLRRKPGEKQRATNLELFFDLVYVFAVTQLSHFLLTHLDAGGVLRTALLLLVVWWAWIYTTWMANWFDPDSTEVRLVLLGVMLASLGMAIAIPEAFGDRALLFAGSYVALQTVRNAFVVWATDRDDAAHEQYRRILGWGLLAAIPWLAGALAPNEWRIPIWILAVAIDYLAPAFAYWTPRLGRADMSTLNIDGGHFSERFQLFIIIALGESIVVTGATASDLSLDPVIGVAIAVAFTGSAALWWLYFDYVAAVSTRRLIDIDETARMGRDAYTYVHILIIAGIIVAAVGDEIVIAHPREVLHGLELGVVIGGPVLYLLGHVAFRWIMAGSLTRTRSGGLVAIALLTVLGLVAPGLVTQAAVNVALIVVIVLEARGFGAPRIVRE